MASNVPQEWLEGLEQLKGYLRCGNSLGILVAGKTGTGKSSLVNSIYLGAKIAQVAQEGDSVTPVTDFIISYSTAFDTPCLDEKRDNVTTLTVFDSPGFGDAFAGHELKQRRIEALKFAIDKADVLLYCVKINDRLSDSDIKGIKKITKSVHPDVWRKAVFVLTFANKVEIPPSSASTCLLSYFNSKLEEWKRNIHTVLKEQAQIPEEIVSDIAIVPVGYHTKSANLPCVNPPDREDWYTPFWAEVFKKTRESGKPGLLRLTWSRLACEDKAPVGSFNRESESMCALPVRLFPEQVIDVGNLHNYLPELSPPGSLVTTTEPSTSVSPTQPESSDESFVMVEHVRHVSLDTGRELRTTAREDTAVTVEDGDAPVKDGNPRKKLLSKAAKIAATVSVPAVAGALIGLVIGIAGGPPGMGIGATVGFAIGGGSGAGWLIAKDIVQRMKKKKAEQTQAATVVDVSQGNTTIN